MGTTIVFRSDRSGQTFEKSLTPHMFVYFMVQISERVNVAVYNGEIFQSNFSFLENTTTTCI